MDRNISNGVYRVGPRPDVLNPIFTMEEGIVMALIRLSTLLALNFSQRYPSFTESLLIIASLSTSLLSYLIFNVILERTGSDCATP